MSDPTTVVEGQVVETTEAPAPSFKDLLARYATIQAFEQALDQYVKDEKAALFDLMCEKSAEDGTKSFNVRIGDETAATATLTESQDKITVADEDALIDFVLDNYPSEVETKTVVRDSFEKVLLKKVRVQDVTPEPTDDEPEPDQVLMFVDPDTGVEVPGLKFIRGGKATTFSVRWKGAAQKKNVLDGLFTQVAPVLGIEAGESE